MNVSKAFEKGQYATHLKKAGLTVPVIFMFSPHSSTGYATGYFGKFLNTDGMSHYCDKKNSNPPPGWDR